MDHSTHIADLGVEGTVDVLDLALRWKHESPPRLFAGKILGMLFFNPSLRTRVSFEAAMIRGGGDAIVLDVDASVWKLEDREGIRMDGDKPEHIREAIPVLARYVDALAVRSFASNKDSDEDERDTLIRQIRRFSTVPVVSMETAREHPCQGLADMLTIREKLGGLAGKRVTLSWAPHIKPLPMAVPHSFMLNAAACGCRITVARPDGFDLHSKVIEEADEYAKRSGGEIRFTNDQMDACKDAEVIYGKSWGPATKMGQVVSFDELARRNADWIIDMSKLAAGGKPAYFMHCLPVRRNVVVTDEVLDHPACIVVDQAENRVHVQRAVLGGLIGSYR